MSKAFLIVLFSLALLAFTGRSQLYTFKNFNHKDGLTIASITSIESAVDGSIWLGTDGAGLIRFDGVHFHEINTGDEYKHHISSIDISGKDLYYTSRYKGVYHNKGNSTKNLNFPNPEKGEWINVTFTGKGIFAATDKSFFFKTEKQIKKLKRFKSITSINQIIEVKEGLIILSTSGNYFLDLSKKTLKPLQYFLPNVGYLNEMQFGYRLGSKIYLFNKKLSKQVTVVLNEQDKLFSFKVQIIQSPLENDISIVSMEGDKKNNSGLFLTSDNNIIVEKSGKFKKVIRNNDLDLAECHQITSDFNGDIWVISTLYGLYKISYEPFTKVLLHPIYSEPDIMALHRSSKGDILLSTGKDKTHIGNIRTNVEFITYDYRTNCFEEHKDKVFLGTNSGVKVFDLNTKEISDLNLNETSGHKITILKIQNDILYVGVAEKGLFKYDLNNNAKRKLYYPKDPSKFFYTAQYSPALDRIYFGSNDGIYFEELNTGKLARLEGGTVNGAYVGVSTKDIHGTIWFTGEKGLTGILENGELVFLNDKKYFNSTLFYTLNSDNYGNLIIGTNKGLTILLVNDQGKVLEQNVYTGTTGFSGYETNMRSQYQDKNTIFVGTIEGLFMINTDIIRNFPKPTSPVISLIQQRKVNNQENSFVFEFSTNNPKIRHLLYSYKIEGYQEEWSDLSTLSKIYLSNLPNGDFKLNVKSTYDGKIYSDVGTFEFSVKMPFWKSRWFIVVLILTIVLVNIYVIQRQKTFDGGHFFQTKDVLSELSLTPAIILFAFLADLSSNYIGPLIDPNIPELFGISSVSAFFLLSLFLLSKNAEKNGKQQYFRLFLILGYSVIMGHYLIGAYVSGLHPFYMAPIAIIVTLATYIFERLRHVIIQNLILMIICCLMVVYMEETQYNKFLFLFLILISCLISIFTTYLRYDSLEKLIFISGIVNKGNVQVVAFNNSGTITYVSENIKDILPTTHEELLNQKISVLNNYLPEDGGYRNVDLTKQFYDGQKYLSPMMTSTNTINWIEWSCKIFSDNVRVILGQNVSDRMELESTYELLVENAEDMIYQCDVHGTLQFINTRMIDLLKTPKEVLVGSNSIDFVHPDYKNAVLEHYKEHFDNRKNSSYFEFPIVSKTGEVRWVGQHVTTLFGASGKGYVNGFLALARDITEKRDQQNIIEEQKNDITSSITYAQRIQVNLLPIEQQFEESFEEHFVIYRPKDIVSGDFYWLNRVENKTVIALGDCTGHGVPGAFMTLLGINILNSLILENRITEPAQILNEMDKKLVQAIKSGNESLKDGLEITICTYDHDTGMLSYACAGSRFLIFENRGFNMFKGDIKHIGDDMLPEFRGFVSHYIPLGKESIVYLLTDGFQDQFGGIKNKRFSFRRLLELFESNTRLPLSEQKNMVEEEFDKWKLQFEQTDDVTIIAFKGPKD